ncbi:F0F1 ATP synthase subunit delta [Legionella sp. CNM-4043-24]|uniref:F0F1 ATP synthase subunit delta n=1 Tax=Legionella sp. CNM-4043-24 TaxID=3421646 RepID=UPI00403A89E4
MADSITIARPYAKAIFEHALSVRKLEQWSNYLHTLASLVTDEQAVSFITNPATNSQQHCDLLLTLAGAEKSDDFPCQKSFVETLAHNKRLLVLPQIVILFDALRSEQEKTMVVRVVSHSALSADQQAQLIQSLGKRLQRQVTLDIALDPDLLGGAVIHAGDLVIDGSVRGKLNKLATGLAA